MIPLGCCGAAAEGFQPSAHGAPVIGFHGFLSGNKRLKELIHATAELARSYSKCKLLALSAMNAYDPDGAQLYLRECESLIAELDLAERIQLVTDFLPLPEVVQRLHQETDIIVLPYTTGASGSSAAVRVAMAAGKPVVTSRIPLFQDVGDEVIQFSVRELPNLAGIIDSVWRNQRLQRWIVERAVQRVKAESFDNVAQRHLALYRSLMAQPASSNGATPARRG